MQRLRNSIVKKMFEQKLTSTQVSFIIYISRVQSINGVAAGIYYRDACAELGVSYQQFYNLLRDLDKKGFIKYEKASYYDYNIQIVDNDWEDQPHKDYVNTNKKMFYDHAFHKMKGAEKLLAMEFQKFIEINKCSFHMRVENLYGKYTKLLGISRRVLRGYLHTIKRFFAIGIKNGQYYISLRKEYKEACKEKTEEEQYRANKIKVFCRRKRIRPQNSEKDFAEVGYLTVQYGDEEVRQGNDMDQLLEECIESSVQGSPGKERWLKPKLIHKLLRRKLNLEVAATGV